MERCENCERCGIRVTYDPSTNSWGPSQRSWRSTCTEKALTESDEKSQTDCPHFDRALGHLIY